MNRFYYSFILFLFIINIKAQCTQVDAGDDVTVDCVNNCTTLTAEVFPGIGALTDTYEVNGATPCPLPTATTTPTNLDDDDEWTNVITLPFTFYFFGNPYNSIILSSNGVVSFEINGTSPVQQPGAFSAWQFSASLPSPDLFHNAIFGAYHDLDPSVVSNNTISYFVSGDYPQRKFVLSFDEVPHFSCNNLHTTQKIVLYETSNVIDVQIDHKDTCNNWNNGNAVVGIQNADGTVAYVPPGRNTGAWDVPASSPELWRFVPNHNPSTIIFDYKWYDDATNTLVGSGQSINVCVTEDTVYRVEADFDDPYGQHYTLSDTVTVFFDDQLATPDLGNDITECDGTSVILDGTSAGATDYQWQKDGIVIPGATGPTLTVTQSGTYTVTVTLGVCTESDDIIVNIEPRPIVSFGPDIISCEGNIETLTPVVSNASGNETYQWQQDGIDIAGATNSTLDVTETGQYTVTVTNAAGCDSSASINVTFDPQPILDLGEDQVVCAYDTVEIVSNIIDADTYHWEVNGTPVNNNTDTLILDTPGDYDVVLTIDRGACTVSDEVHITILEPITVIPNPQFYGLLDIDVTGGLSPYQYSVDGSNFQESSHFENLPDGDYYISIKDDNGCEYDDVIMTHVTNLVFYQFFTPNGDGFNDFWRIGNAENTPDANLYIYDRFGKLVRLMNTEISEVWDGTLNGNPLPSGDYWYMLILPEGKVFKGHFALKR